MSFSLPPILKIAERLLVDIELAVMRFSRSHKYVFGTDLRKAAMEVVKRTQRAWRDRENQARRVAELVHAVDDLKIHLQHASTHRLRNTLHRRYPWLHAATVNRKFHHRAEHREIAIVWSHH